MQILQNSPSEKHIVSDAEHIKKDAQHFDEDALVITELKAAVRNPARVNVFVNGKYEFSLTLEQVVDLKVKRGQELTPEELAELKAASELEKLYQRTLEWVLLRPRSVQETRDYLVRKQRTRVLAVRKYEAFQERMKNDAEYRERVKDLRARAREEKVRIGLPVKPGTEITNKQIEQVIEKLIGVRALDDKKFAQWFVENRRAAKGVSVRRLRMELAKKGVARAVVEQALLESERDDAEEIQKLIAKKWGRYETPEKLIQYLVRQGFDWGTARSAVQSFDPETD